MQKQSLLKHGCAAQNSEDSGKRLKGDGSRILVLTDAAFFMILGAFFMMMEVSSLVVKRRANIINLYIKY